VSGASGKSFDKGRAAHPEAPAKASVSRPSGSAHDAVFALQRAAGNRAVTSLLGGSSGKPLDSATREEMETRFGHNFRGVRVHTGTEAARAADIADAKAYTFGRDIVFNEGRYAPSTATGKRLLAHELAHVVQQGRSPGMASGRAESPSLEASAERAAASAQSVSQIQVSGAAAPGVARSPNDKKLLDLPERGVEMPWVGKGPGIDSSTLGYLRDSKKFWEEYSTAHGTSLSPENLAAAAAGKPAVVDSKWIEENPQHAGYEGDTLVHHHVGKGGKAVPIPEQLHKTQSSALHPTDQPLEGTGKVTPASELAGMPEGELHPVDPVTGEWHAPRPRPSVEMNQPTAEAVASRQQAESLKPNYRRKPPKAEDINDFEIREEATPQGPSTRPEPADKIKANERRRARRQARKAAAAEKAAAEKAAAEKAAASGETTPKPAEPVAGEGPVGETAPKPAEPVGGEAPVVQAAPEPIGPTAPTAPAQDVPTPSAEAAPTAPAQEVPTPSTPETPSTVEPNTSEIEEVAEGVGRVSRLGGKLGKGLKVGGHVLGAAGAVYGTYEETKAGIAKGESKGEALSGALGSTAGGFTASPGAVVANLANTGVQAVGSHLVEKAQREHPNDPAKVQEIKKRVEAVTGTTQTMVEVLPSSTITQGVKAFGRSAWNLSHGDMKAMDKQAEGFERGEAGAPLMGLTMMTDLGASIAGGEDPEHALNRVAKMGENTPVAKLGDYLGDQTYQFINKDLPEAAEFAKKDVHEVKEAAKKKLSGAWNWLKGN